MGSVFPWNNRGVSDMENPDTSKKIFLSPAHLPTMLLIIGYPVYWLELYGMKRGDGTTSLLAPLLFLLSAVYVLGRHGRAVCSLAATFKDFIASKQSGVRFFLGTGCVLSALILLCVWRAALLPPHLIQEFDALHYHYTLPRQHLLMGSFQHILWAADDLFLLPLDFALAPYWFATPLANKFPQFIFLLGMISVSLSLGRQFSQERFIRPALILFAILGSHHIGIQMGTAMLDLVIAYLFLAALDSLFKGNYGLFLVEFTFFFWAKSFIPLQMTSLLVLFFVLLKFQSLFGWNSAQWGFDQSIPVQIQWADFKPFRKVGIGFLLLSIFIAGPFLIKSLYYAGTPLFPFAPGVLVVNKDMDLDSRHWQSMLDSSQTFMSEVKNGYGHGRSFWAFMKHFWLIAVPESGVNNRFDYPVGLVYLLILGPFVYRLLDSWRKKELAVLPFFVVLYWLSWWFGSQQSRFLYIPILLMMILVISSMRETTKVFVSVLLLALLLNALSLARSHQQDWGRPAASTLRPRDRELIEMSREYIKSNRKDVIELDFHDVVFAQFPVKVTRESLPHTLALPEE